MRLFSYLAVLAGLTFLSACASDAPAPQQAEASQPVANNAAQTMTGSRIPARRTEKMVSATTGKDYEQDANSKRAPLIVN